MAGGWTIAVHILFPIPFMLLTLLSIPLPDSIRQKVRHYILSFTGNAYYHASKQDRIFNLTIAMLLRLGVVL
jgi:hypothetical protein